MDHEESVEVMSLTCEVQSSQTTCKSQAQKYWMRLSMGYSRQVNLGEGKVKMTLGILNEYELGKVMEGREIQPMGWSKIEKSR